MGTQVVAPATPTRPEVVEVAGVRKFGDPALQAALDAVAQRLPPGKNAFEVGVQVDEGKNVTSYAVVKLGDRGQWSVMGALDKQWKKPITGRISLGWSG